MKFSTLILYFLFPWSVVYLNGQQSSVLNREVTVIAEQFNNAAEISLAGHNIAIGDIVDQRGNHVELGKILADELTYALQRSNTEFTIVDRKYFQQLMDESDLRNTGLINTNSAVALGDVAGVSAIVYGTIHQQSNSYTIYLSYSILEQQIKQTLTKGFLSRVPTTDAMFYRTVSEDRSELSETVIAPTVSSTNQSQNSGNLRISFEGCSSAGSGIINCNYTISALNRNESVIIYKEGSFLQLAHGRISPVSLALGPNRGSFQLSSSLRLNKSVPVSLQFSGISPGQMNSGEAVLHLKAPSTYDLYFQAKL